MIRNRAVDVHKVDGWVGEYVIVTGESILDLEANTLHNRRTGKTFQLKPLGEAGPVIDAGGLFNYARRTGMIVDARDAKTSRSQDTGTSAGPDD